MTGRDLRQAWDDVRASDVAGMNDVLDTGERLYRLGAQQAVGVGDDADQHGRIERRTAPRRERFAEVPYLVRSVATARRRRNSATGSGSPAGSPRRWDCALSLIVWRLNGRQITWVG